MSIMLALIGAIGAKRPIRFSGSFDNSGAPTTVTSATRTATVPGGNSGLVQFDNLNPTGVVNQSYSINGAAFVAFSEDTQITLANSDTLAVRITNAASGESLTFDLTDVTTNTVIENVSLISA